MYAPGHKTGDAGGGSGDRAEQQSAKNSNTGNVLGYVPTHWDRKLSAATGSVAKAMEATKTQAELRT